MSQPLLARYGLRSGAPIRILVDDATPPA